ncbi:hypothetical protein LSTR_LSTR006928 [Laodelphax striatellus]|uniref:Uncharacterized protein n=1 Tax=Laodelphax striatellus TaxID=195883 RepID=A0A482X375_LAOST|nr:hypothetical protein LSTR_LSTR006928 [Laodelphax striatellus]
MIPVDSLSPHVPPYVGGQKLRNHAHKPKPPMGNDQGYEDSEQQTFFQNEGERVTSLKSDENFRKRGSKPHKHQGELVSYTTTSPILITQKPLVLVNNDDEDAHKRRLIQNRVSSQHKSVSIMPSSSEHKNGRINLGINSQPTQNPSLFITPRPSLMSTSVPFNDDTNNLNTNIKKNHKPKRQRPVRPGYSNTEVVGSGKEAVKRIKKPNLVLSKNNDFSSTRSPLFVTPGPNSVSSVAPQQDLYPFARPNNNGETLIVESVPSISIALKPSNNNNGATNIRPIFIGGNNNGNLGLVDYLVPPRISPTFPDVRPTGNQQQNIFNDEKSIENEMTRLKPPLPTNTPRPKKSNTNKKVNGGDKINNHNMRNHNTRVPNKQRNKFHNHKMTQALEVSPTENVNLNYNNHHQAASPSYTDILPTRNENLMKNHNSGHHKPAPTYSDTPPSRKENLMKNHNSDHHHEAASHIDEQISSETGFLRDPSHHSTGERVEFQMHGQNGPKSYKFGYDTGKGHNRQFRYEERDKHGHVKGHYGYYDKDGKLQVVNYEADPETGFKANPVDMSPDQN